MGRRIRCSAALLVLALAPLTLAGVMDACSVRVDLDDFASEPDPDAAATTALQDAIDASDLCMAFPHVVEITGDVTLTQPLLHQYPVPVVVRGVGEERSVLSGGGTHRIVLIDPVSLSGAEDLTLERVELRDGLADERVGPMVDIEGGAVWAPVGAGIVVTVRDAILADNVAVPDGVRSSAGGAIAADDVVLEDVAVVGNTAEYGGALAVGTLEARRVTFEDNGTIAASVCAAGGVSVCAADATVTTLWGGAVLAGLTVTLENVTFHDNRARIGGALWMDASEPVMDLGVGTASVEPRLDATFVTFVGNAATSGSHVAGFATDETSPDDLVPARFRATLFLDAVALPDVSIAEAVEGEDCVGLDVADGDAPGSRSNGSECPGAPIAGAAGESLDGPDDHGAVGRTFLPTAAALIDVVDCSVGTWPDEDQRGEERPQGDGCEVGALEVVVEEDDDPEDDPRDDRRRAGTPVPSAVPSGAGPSAPWWRWLQR